MLEAFCQPGRADFIVGGQFGSEAKGAAAAWLAVQLARQGRWYDCVTTNAGAQAGHTSIHDGKKRVVFHLPTVPLIAGKGLSYLNAGAIIDPQVLIQEVHEHQPTLLIHPNAAVITNACKQAEGLEDSAQTKIASTRKGVGEALARKVLRSGVIARDDAILARQWLCSLELNRSLSEHKAAILVEVPQGYGLSVNGRFYPHCTSRNCTVMQAMSDAEIHPSFLGATMLVLRTYPIRVGNIGDNSSGGCYPDQEELTWAEIGVEPEITTVTKRVRRVFSWSTLQVADAMMASRPSIVFLSHTDYVNDDGIKARLYDIYRIAKNINIPRPQMVLTYGPTTEDFKLA